ncbi:uncharacterized SAM-binding protein YcdF (DUF218 family) [Natronocella acetinitrilica]|uniref:Uncharacterized SAM-binding protein YcdF (DUF218 family) n=1 Tax=Natronocella acetinitrilica TaxID=414046 RepID=A0AAE3G1Z9_9GAMM|nr:YdcF family protein [Natronocella acetinitrilica]MCP1672973.1 uncharacterized SAM-binding protein YcdF (DUF218 family) [Natronocella acetinitrilica]
MWWSSLSQLVLPPGGPVILGLIGLLLWRRKLGKGLVVLSLASLYALSTPLLSFALVSPLERTAALPVDDLPDIGEPAAIVVLGGGRRMAAPEYGADTVNWWSLERVRYGARLHRQLGLPLLVSGGTPGDDQVAEAALMATALEEDFGAPVTWLEPRSRNTQENAYFSAGILQDAGIDHVILVTSALHMPRSVKAFERAGVSRVTPAPTGFLGRPADEPLIRAAALLPDRHSLQRSTAALHEHLGSAWYRLLYR